jgi:hypothetical protein
MVFIVSDTGKPLQLPCPGEITVGRSEDTKIKCNVNSVSNLHAKIKIEPTDEASDSFNIFLEDLNTTSGTFVSETKGNEEKVIGRRKLNYGDYIRFGENDAFFQLIESLPPPPLLVDTQQHEMGKSIQGKMEDLGLSSPKQRLLDAKHLDAKFDKEVTLLRVHRFYALISFLFTFIGLFLIFSLLDPTCLRFVY